MNFIVFKKVGPKKSDMAVVGLVEGKKKEEAKQAIEEVVNGLEDQTGRFFALPFNKGDLVRFKTSHKLVLDEVTEAEEEAAPSVTPVEPPTPGPQPPPVPET